MTFHGNCMFLMALAIATSVSAQTPQPFPGSNRPVGRPAQPPAPQPPSMPEPGTSNPGPGASRAQVPATPANNAARDDPAPTAAELGFPVYPTAQFLTSYDAGRGQRYYLFGSTASFADLVQYYRSVLKERGNLVFEQPATHMFEVGRFRDGTMAFPPGVTIKDYSTGVSGGYPNPKPNPQPARFATIIQIVPAPPPAAPARR